MEIGKITFDLILLATAMFFLLIQILYFIFLFFRVAFHRTENIRKSELPPVSVVIAARSEAHNLVEFLPYIFEQNYPQFEVVVVNDRSWDDTKDILKAFLQKYPNLHVVNIEEGNHKSPGKKMAITLGIKGAKYEHIVVTDADCKPLSREWLAEIASGFTHSGIDLVIGYSPFKRAKGFLNKLIRFDGMWVALQYLSFAKAGIPYMGVGRNMAYKKDAFFKVGGFRKHYHILSGDDDLFVNEIARKNNTVAVFTANSHIETLPKDSASAWFVQKRRHYSTAPMYRLKHKLLLSFWSFSLVSFYGIVLVLLVLNKYLLITLGLLLFRTLLLMLTFIRAGKWLGNKDLLWGVFFYELIFIFLYPILFFGRKKNKKPEWS